MKVLANFEDNHKIPTNSAIDNLLNGGVEKGTITQIFGPPGSGKSNIALVLAVNVAKQGKKVVYVDTEGGISINRIKQIAGEDFSKIVNNIIVFEPTSFLEQNENLKTIELWIRKHHDDVDLCVLDSAVALYRVDDMKSSRLNKELGKQMGILAKIVRNYDVAVVLTNQIYSSFDDDNKDAVKAVGGTILQYWSKTIIQLERNEEFNKRIATLKRHRSIGEGKQVTFKIVERGII